MRWEQLPQTGSEAPGPRSSHALAAVTAGQQHLYLFGGELEARVPLPAQLWKYDMATGAWSVVATKPGSACPGPRVGATLVALGSRLFLFGGRTGREMTEGALCDLHMLDTAAAEPEWVPVAVAGGGASPPPRSYHSAVAAGDSELFIFGGCGASGRRNDLWGFNTATSTWTELSADGDAAAPCARGGPVLVAVPGKNGSPKSPRLCVLGGFNGAELADCRVFDTATRSWDDDGAAAAAPDGSGSQQTMPLARSVFGAALHGGAGGGGGCGCEHAGHVVLFGGEVAPSDKGHAGAGNFTAALTCLALAAAGGHGSCSAGHDHGGSSSGWHDLAPAAAAAAQAGATPRGWFAATPVSGGRGVLVVHGGLGADNQRLGDLWLLTCTPAA